MPDVPSDLVVRFPARRGYLGISRLNATALAADQGFDVDELDDLRLAVDEAVSWLLSNGGNGASEGAAPVHHEIELVISCHDGRLEFDGRHSRPHSDAPALNDLSQAVLAVTVDHYEAGVDGDGRRSIKLIKRVGSDG